MPERGWVNLTIRVETKRLLKQEAEKAGLSIDLYIRSLLTSQVILQCIRELTSQPPDIIEKVKKHVYEKVGTIKFKCECGKITEYLDLILTGGKCPKCEMALIKFSKHIDALIKDIENVKNAVRL